MPVAPEHAGGGPYYAAWVEADEATFGIEHHRYDEYVLSYEFILEEGKISELTLVIKNPGALIGIGRKRWLWFAKDEGTDVVPWFFGQVSAVPGGLLGETITIHLIAKPLDYEERKSEVADGLKELPFWDEVFIAESAIDDADAVIEAYPVDWHVDPVTHEVSVSDLLVGEDGLEVFTAGEAFYDSVDFKIGTPPLLGVAVDATVTWTQTASGVIDFGTKDFFTYTGSGLVSGWPQPATSLQGGWSVQSATATDMNQVESIATHTFNYNYKNEQATHRDGDTMSITETETRPLFHGPAAQIQNAVTISFVVGDPDTGKAGSTSVQRNTTFVPQWWVQGKLQLRYDAARPRTEHLRFTLSADLQSILEDDGGTSSNIETLTISGGDVGRVLGEGTDSSPPIGDLSRRSYFPTDRGLQSVQYCIAVARAHLLQRSRSGLLDFSTTLENARRLTLRKNVQLHDARLPAGVALGKPIKIAITGDGSSGRFIGAITAACAVGKGTAIVEVEGDPVYAAPGYMARGYQRYEGAFIALPSEDVGYTPPVDDVNDDGLIFPLSKDQVVVRDEIVHTLAQQDAALVGSAGRPTSDWTSTAELAGFMQAQSNAILASMAALQVRYELELKPLTGSFEHEFVIDAGPLVVPQQIDLGESGGTL